MIRMLRMILGMILRMMEHGRVVQSIRFLWMILLLIDGI